MACLATKIRVIWIEYYITILQSALPSPTYICISLKCVEFMYVDRYSMSGC